MIGNESIINSTIEIEDSIKVATKYLWRVLGVLLLLFGCTGNCISFVVLLRIIKSSPSPTYLFLSVLVVTDTVVLITGLSRYWTLNTFDYDLRTISDTGCKISLFVIYLSMQFSSWILVSVTAERCYTVCRPLTVRQTWTRSRAKLLMVTIFVILVGVNAHFFKTNGLRIGEDNTTDCTSLNDEYFYFDEYVFVWIDFLVLSLIPLTVMLICNIIVIEKMKKGYNIRRTLTEDTRCAKGKSNHNIRSVYVSNKTRVVILLNVFFAITSVPISVYFIVDTYFKHSSIGYSKSTMKLVWTLCYLLQYFHFAVNILFYSLRERRFQKELKTILCKRQQGTNSITSNNRLRSTNTSSTDVDVVCIATVPNISGETKSKQNVYHLFEDG